MRQVDVCNAYDTKTRRLIKRCYRNILIILLICNILLIEKLEKGIVGFHSVDQIVPLGWSVSAQSVRLL